MGYKYYNLATSASITPNTTLIDGFQALLNQQFSIASDFFTITEEVTFGSNVYSNVDVRINGAISSVTSEKLGDDFKTILFKDLTHAVSLGRKFYFDGNYFITVFTEAIKNLAQSCTVRRCNQVLRWMDTNGNYFEEPAIVDYFPKRDVNNIGKDLVLPEGYVSIYSQLNAKTRLLKPNQRFIFGSGTQWNSLYIFGFGLLNYNNLTTFNNDSAQLLTIQAGVSYANSDIDNFSLGIADYYKTIYALSPTPVTISGSAGNSVQVVPNVQINSVAVTRPMTYSSSASSICTVSGSGLVTLVSNGSATISLYVTANISASAIIPVTISASAVMGGEVRVIPSDGFILENDTSNISVYNYQNGVIQADTFTFALADSNVPTDNYIFTVTDGNHISVRNVLMYLGYPLLINCTSGSNVKQISLQLRGAW